MTKLEELENELERLKSEIEKLKVEEKQEKKCTRWKPSAGDAYWCINGNGIANELHWVYDIVDKGAYSIGDCFQTKEEAEFEIERLKVIAEMKEFAFEPDWNDVSQLKYCIYYNYHKDEIMGPALQIEYYYSTKYCDIYFESFKKAQECINAVGADRIKKYYFRVEE